MSLQDSNAMASGQNDVVRDNRGKDWFWANNAIYDEVKHPETGATVTFAQILGPSAVSVYMFLARLADNRTQTCYPSYPTIESRVGISHGTATNTIHKLCDHGLILRAARAAEEGDRTSNLYTLLPIENWIVQGGIENILPSVRARLQPKKSVKKTTGRTKNIRQVVHHKDDRSTIIVPKQDSGELTLKKQDSQQQQTQTENVVDVSDSIESVSASSSQSNGSASNNRVLELPQNGATPVEPSAAQKRARANAQKQFEAGQSALPQVAAVGQSRRGQSTSPIAEKLIAIGTGADPRTVMRYASMHPDHAELVARYFPDTPENTPEYWDEYNEKTGKSCTRASGLIARLQNTQWEPPPLRAERIKEERAEAARLRREREQTEREMSNKSHDEEFANRQREYLETVERYRALPSEARHEIREAMWKDATILRDSTIDAEKKGLLKLQDGAPPSSLLDGWTPDHSQFARFAACLQLALREYSMLHQEDELDEEFDEEYIEPEPLSDAEFVERQISYLMEERGHKWDTLDELENRRIAHAFDGADFDEMWAQIRAGVEAQVLDQAA